MWMKLDKVRLAHRVEEGLVDHRRGLGLGFLRDDDLLRVDDDKVEAEFDGVHDVTITNILRARFIHLNRCP